MIIQVFSNIASTYCATYKSAVERQTSPAPEAKYADKVTLSTEGKTLAADESKPVFTQQRTYAQERLLQAASSDRASAEKIAYDLAKTPSTIFYDISGQRGVGDGTGEFVRKLSTTGEIVGDDYIEKFFSEASAIDAQRFSIYETETKKGTDPVEILSKMIDFTNQQSQDYLDATGWGWRGSAPPA
ncbi:MAG: hypothetical protein U0989_04890 [Azonexus sp.]|nr:hypothetical protein [Azonexus sp.]